MFIFSLLRRDKQQNFMRCLICQGAVQSAAIKHFGTGQKCAQKDNFEGTHLSGGVFEQGEEKTAVGRHAAGG